MNNVLLGLGGLAGGYLVAKMVLGGEKKGVSRNPRDREKNFRKVHTHIDDWHPHGSKSQVRQEYKQIVDYMKSAPSHANWYAAMEAGSKAVQYTGDYQALKPDLSRVAKMLGKEIPYNSPKPHDAILAIREYMPESKSALLRHPVRNSSKGHTFSKKDIGTKEWHKKRCYAGPPEIGEVGHFSANDIEETVRGRIVDVGSHWSSQPTGESGWWVEYEIIGPSYQY